MANITQYSGTFVEGNDGNHIVSWIGEESDYLAIQRVSMGNAVSNANYDITDANFDPAYNNTLYYIYDDLP